ncbi:hypothetical protein FDECE_4196 [Fusarium decemcellulare]|nr:hypothetical protein FDECE_4196 [Fusarium decemcellulare]
MRLLNDIAPRQTAPPSLDDLHRRTAGKNDLITISVAPDNTCGFISGRPGASRVCSGDSSCLFFPPAPSRSVERGGVFCCGTSSCEYHATCVNSVEYFESSKCDGGCEVDNYTLKCTDSASPYCNTVSWKGSTFDYWCNDVDITTAQSAALSFKGQKSRVFTTVDEDDLSSIQSQISEAKTGNIETGATRTSGPSATNTDSSDSGASKTNTGAIAGGVVGGVAGLALVSLGIFYLFRRQKKKYTAGSPPAYQPPGAPGAPMAGADPKAGWPAGQQQGYQYDPNSPSTLQTMSPGMAQNMVSPNSAYGQTNIPGYQSGYQPQQPVIHEAGGDAVGSQPQELPESGPGKKEPVELA